jgi:uncharacterized Ntn-hydrolase superfamily protein
MLARRLAIALLIAAPAANAQVPASWRDSLNFSTFSIAAIDPRTGETGVAVTTRVACVGNGVPWVRKGVGAVATQASTRTEYGNELLDALAKGEAPDAALKRLTAGDSSAQSRQIGVIGLDGRSAQHTGTGTSAWSGHRSGKTYATQGNTLVGPEVLEAVAKTFEKSENTSRHLADRLIEALNAGHILGGDRRHGNRQSAAVVVSDPRAGMARRTDGQTVNINVCEHPEPLDELRRIYNTVSQTLGFRTLQQFSGSDIWQLKVMLHALGYYKKGEATLTRPQGQEANLYTAETVAAVDAFRASEKLYGGAAPGLVDAVVVDRLWAALEKAGKANDVRKLLLETTMVRR